jgi:hypothetical protein
MGAIGLFISALVRRTQTATVLTYVVVLALSFGTLAVHQFLVVTTTPSPTGSIIVSQRHKAPEALLWLNPFVADLDLVCTTVPGSFHESCVYMSQVTGKPYFGTNYNYGIDLPGRGIPPVPMPMPIDDNTGGGLAPGVPGDTDVVVVEPDGAPAGGAGKPADADAVAPQATLSLGFPRDTFWPKSAAAFGGVGLLLTLLSAQLVAPTRRLRLRLPVRRSVVKPAAVPAATDQPPADDGLPMETDE